MTKIGVLIPSREYFLAGQTDARRLVDFAVRAERFGFDSVWTGDSLYARPRVEPLTLLAAVAGATSTVQIGTAAVTLALRHPVLTAHAVATLDQVSAGRSILGVGAGFPYPSTEEEFEVAGVPFAGRVQRLLDSLRLVRALWSTHDPADAARVFQEFGLPEGLTELPKPVQPGGPPVWFAGGGPKALERVGKYFDGWLPYPPTANDYGAGLEVIAAAAREAGRDPGSISAGLYVTVNCVSDPAKARSELDEFCSAYYGFGVDVIELVQAFYGGDLEGCVEWLRGYVEAGADHVILRFGTLDPDAHLDWAGEHLLPALRERLSEARGSAVSPAPSSSGE